MKFILVSAGIMISVCICVAVGYRVGYQDGSKNGLGELAQQEKRGESWVAGYVTGQRNALKGRVIVCMGWNSLGDEFWHMPPEYMGKDPKELPPGLLLDKPKLIGDK